MHKIPPIDTGGIKIAPTFKNGSLIGYGKTKPIYIHKNIDFAPTPIIPTRQIDTIK
jgi:hypothetical protein